jgi:hypothetical protein
MRQSLPTYVRLHKAVGVELNVVPHRVQTDLLLHHTRYALINEISAQSSNHE